MTNYKDIKKIRKEFEEWIAGFSEADIVSDGEWIWDFIEQSLIKQREEILEEVEKVADDMFSKNMRETSEALAYRTALLELVENIKFLNHK